MLCGFPPYFSNPLLKDTVDFLSNAPFWYFINEDTEELRNEIKEGAIDFPLPFWDNVSDLAKDFIKALLKVAEKDRLTADQALAHPWMTDEIVSPEQRKEEHLLLDPFRKSGDFEHSLGKLPAIVSLRTKNLRGSLENLLLNRPRLSELRDSGIYKSFSESSDN